jgi:hypothetical protein
MKKIVKKGMYFVTVASEDFVNTKKLILVN